MKLVALVEATEPTLRAKLGVRLDDGSIVAIDAPLYDSTINYMVSVTWMWSRAELFAGPLIVVHSVSEEPYAPRSQTRMCAWQGSHDGRTWTRTTAPAPEGQPLDAFESNALTPDRCVSATRR